MKTKYKKELKLPNDLVAGDNIKIGGLLCEVLKAEWVYHDIKPKGRIRISLKVVGATPKREEAMLFLPPGTPIETLR